MHQKSLFYVSLSIIMLQIFSCFIALLLFCFRLTSRKNRSYGHQQKLRRPGLPRPNSGNHQCPRFCKRELGSYRLAVTWSFVVIWPATKLSSCVLYNLLIWVRRYAKYLTPPKISSSFYGAIVMLQIFSSFIFFFRYNLFISFFLATFASPLLL